MIPKIYNDRINDKKSITGSFPRQSALGRLSDCIYCKLFRERNGQDEIEFSYPIDGIHIDLIKPFCIVSAIGPGDASDQGYIIYKITKKMNRVIVVNAFHITYFAKWCTFNPPANNGVPHVGYYAQYLLDKIISGDPDQYRWNNNYPVANETFINVEYAIQGAPVNKLPATLTELVAGSDNSYLSRVGGDVTRGRVELGHTSRMGSDNGFVVRYGKNMTGIKWYADYSNVYTACVPYWQNGSQIVKPEDAYTRISSASTCTIQNYNVVRTDHVDDYPYLMVRPLDLSQYFDAQPTVAQLQAKALEYMNANKVWEPAVSVDVNFVDLSKAAEYNQHNQTFEYGLGDDVTVINEELGIELMARVEYIEYDILLEQIVKTRIGNKRITFADIVAGRAGA